MHLPREQPEHCHLAAWEPVETIDPPDFLQLISAVIQLLHWNAGSVPLRILGYRKMSALEVQIDRIVGPTHHFGGLGLVICIQLNAGQASNPQAAALQGLDKMRLVASLGVPQLILPPQPRPDFHLLADLGLLRGCLKKP